MNNENQTIQDGNYKATVENGKVTIYTGNQNPEDQQLASKLMDKIGTKVNDLALLILLKEGNISYKDMELNKKTDKAVKDFVSYIRQLKNERYDRRYIERHAQEKAKEIEEEYHKNATLEVQKWTDWQNKVIARFKEDKLIANTQFEDPQTEILKRCQHRFKIVRNHRFKNVLFHRFKCCFACCSV
ncbi:hypothetical protein H5S40_00900 [Limosilactobacillus sp. RRLNB_1_1]|uniref:Uncharacterized protein n=1 Tax=Limosilactobacillus albertensis TaxID=2759752 RepID=A0A7W3Y7B2_9LACO|nr:hypothetical protein [Limosilactobacillus albertensis]MBB1068755.1 hypothetical protein [Limosilactobacillus albertensis]MCD7118300.1 hypothetical protein [Limosilactobacillus albertensis]MCD7127508.1 hypothetical protein [Limosilactobacillus albertensis]